MFAIPALALRLGRGAHRDVVEEHGALVPAKHTVHVQAGDGLALGQKRRYRLPPARGPGLNGGLENAEFEAQGFRGVESSGFMSRRTVRFRGVWFKVRDPGFEGWKGCRFGV